MRTMKAITITKQGVPVAPNIAIAEDWPDPQPDSNQVLVRTEAAALNHLDLWVGRGLPGIDLEYPRISGSDGCGVIEAVGRDVDESWIGTRVILNGAMPQCVMPGPDHVPAMPDILMIGEHTHGTMAERFLAPVTNVIDIGDADPVEAAAFGLTHLTAWRMMWTRGRVQPGQWVLITGIGGGVALAALNIARHLGCRTIVTSRHQHKLDRAAELGADHGVLDTGEDWSREVRSITGKRGVDLCVESVGKAVHLSCIKALARGGTLVSCGCTTGPDATTDFARIFWNQLSIIGSTMGDMNEFREVAALFTRGAIKPVIDSVYDANNAQDAYARIESGEQFGKVVIKW